MKPGWKRHQLLVPAQVKFSHIDKEGCNSKESESNERKEKKRSPNQFLSGTMVSPQSAKDRYITSTGSLKVSGTVEAHTERPP